MINRNSILMHLPVRVSAIGVGALLYAEVAGAALIDRGNGLIYDSTSGLTWLQDGNTFASQLAADPNLASKIVNALPVDSSGNHFVSDAPNGDDTPPNSGVRNVTSTDFLTSGATGLMSWWGAKAWVNYLNSIDYKGSHQWSLPTTDGCVQYNCTNSQWGQLYYSALGNVAYPAQGYGLSHVGPFNNLQTYAYYWLDGQYASNPNSAWAFDAKDGFQGVGLKIWFGYAEAVDLTAVPEPGRMGLLALGLGVLALMLRKRSLDTSVLRRNRRLAFGS